MKKFKCQFMDSFIIRALGSENSLGNVVNFQSLEPIHDNEHTSRGNWEYNLIVKEKKDVWKGLLCDWEDIEKPRHLSNQVGLRKSEIMVNLRHRLTIGLKLNDKPFYHKLCSNSTLSGDRLSQVQYAMGKIKLKVLSRYLSL